MLKFIFIALALYVAYKLFATDFLKKKQADLKEEQKEKENKIAAGEMVKDPECGTYVAIEDSISVRKGDQAWYFCSYECRDSFLKKLEAGETPNSAVK